MFPLVAAIFSAMVNFLVKRSHVEQLQSEQLTSLQWFILLAQ